MLIVYIMARRLMDGARKCSGIFIILPLLFRISFGAKNQLLYADLGSDCGKEYKIGGATVYSHYRPESATYKDLQECTITFAAEQPDWKLMLNFEILDIPDQSFNGVCNDALYIYDSKRLGENPFSTAGGNNGLCGDSKPGTLTSRGPYIVMLFRSDTTNSDGRGFKFQVTAFKNADSVSSNPCGQYFMCHITQRCIEPELVCDRVDHCGDGSDEELDGRSRCNPTAEDPWWTEFLSLGVAACVGIVVGGIVVLVLLIVCVVCTCRRCGKKPGDDNHRQSIPSSHHGSVNGQQMYKDGVAYQPVPQSVTQNHMMGQQYLHQMPQHSYPGNAMQHNMNQMNQQQRYMGGPVVDGSMQMAVMNQGPMHQSMGGASQPHMGVQHLGGQPLGGFNHGSPFHQPRGESHSYSSGYSSQQGMVGGGFHPMHTKPIISGRRYTPTSGSSRSSQSASSAPYSRGDSKHLDNHRHHSSDDRSHMQQIAL